MTRTEDERIKQNERKINALRMENARLQKKANMRARKMDTRRKIVAGAIILNHAEIDEVFAVKLYELLDKFVSERDRHMFDLPEINERHEIDAASSFNRPQPEP